MLPTAQQGHGNAYPPPQPHPSRSSHPLSGHDANHHGVNGTAPPADVGGSGSAGGGGVSLRSVLTYVAAKLSSEEEAIQRGWASPRQGGGVSSSTSTIQSAINEKLAQIKNRNANGGYPAYGNGNANYLGTPRSNGNSPYLSSSLRFLGSPSLGSPSLGNAAAGLSSFSLASLIPSPSTTAFLLGCLLWYSSSALSSNTSKALLSSSKAGRHHRHHHAAAAAAMMSHTTPGLDHASEGAMVSDYDDASSAATAAVPSPAPFPYPVTLTLIQFGFVHVFCLALCSPRFMASLARLAPGSVFSGVNAAVARRGWDRPVTKLRKPSKGKVREMVRLSVFNVVGHALGALAIARVPVSTVHTIKALTPLFTVAAFRFLFGVRYNLRAYASLLPLTLGVMMACTGLSFNANDVVGLAAALGSTCVFVAQNIVSKKLMSRGGGGGGEGAGGSGGATSSGGQAKTGATSGHSSSSSSSEHGAEKMDKINILYYSSGLSVLLMIPMMLWSDGWKILVRIFGSAGPASVSASAQAVGGGAAGGAASSSPGRIVTAAYILYLLSLNGLVHFAQNLLAFNVLSLVSPVTYSIASLFKRVFVIVVAIIWFGQSVSLMQWAGIFLTFTGLWMYNQSKSRSSVAAGEAKMRRDERVASLVLPTTRSQGLADLGISDADGGAALGATTRSTTAQQGTGIYASPSLGQYQQQEHQYQQASSRHAPSSAGFRDFSAVASGPSSTAPAWGSTGVEASASAPRSGGGAAGMASSGLGHRASASTTAQTLSSPPPPAPASSTSSSVRRSTMTATPGAPFGAGGRGGVGAATQSTTTRSSNSPSGTTTAAAGATSSSTPTSGAAPPPFLRDPRASIPSPPPSGRSSPDEHKSQQRSAGARLPGTEAGEAAVASSSANPDAPASSSSADAAVSPAAAAAAAKGDVATTGH